MADGTERGGWVRMEGPGVRMAVVGRWGEWGWGGDLNLKGALPQWESLPMNNHTDEPQRETERGMGGREVESEWKRKNKQDVKKEIRMP